jgi:hypothetical protein
MYGVAVTPRATICTVKNDTLAGLLLARLAPAAIAGNSIISINSSWYIKFLDIPGTKNVTRHCQQPPVSEVKTTKSSHLDFLLDMRPPKDYNFSRSYSNQICFRKQTNQKERNHGF